MFRFFLCWLGFLFVLHLAKAQNALDSTLLLTEVEVVAKLLRKHPVGTVNQQWQTEDQKRNGIQTISDLLQLQSTTFVKSYGAGSLATSSIRGGSAGHTLILWNGVPIQSPMLGLLDLSLLPIGSTDQVQLQKGGQAALWGSGAIGGVLSLQNQSTFGRHLEVQSNTNIGSFGQLQQQVTFKIGNQKIQSVTKVLHHQAENNFTYQIGDNKTKIELPNAQINQQNVMQDLHFRLSPNDVLSTHFWWQQSDRNIPPTLTQTRSTANQVDQSKRLIINWKHHFTKAISNTKISYLDEDLDYFDPTIRLSSISNFKTLFGEWNSQWQLKKQSLYLGLTHNHTRAEIENYGAIQTENRTAIFASLQSNKSKKWQWQASLRQELVDRNLVPFIPMLGIDYQLFPHWQIKAQVSRNFRLPTLNDRFWMPGGNPNLQPEIGWSQEATILHKGEKQNWNWSYQLTGFNRLINNWILWSPSEDQRFWSAQNIAQVWSRGLEQQLNIQYQFQQLKFNFTAAYDYIRSSNQIALELPRIGKGQQLFYTPIHQGFVRLGFQWKQLSAFYHHQWIGSSIGINEALPFYHLAHANLNYQLEKGQWSGSVFFKINNIWNTQYQVIERRAMPGINFQSGLIINFKR